MKADILGLVATRHLISERWFLRSEPPVKRKADTTL